jgi:hypothetical protein
MREALAGMPDDAEVTVLGGHLDPELVGWR